MKLFKVTVIVWAAFGWGVFVGYMIWSVIPSKQLAESKAPVEKSETKTDNNGHEYLVQWRHSKGCECLR